MSGKLSFVATPIGNLGDMSKRALDTLSACDEILCEDTRNSLKLLSYFNIQKPLFPFHKFNYKKETPFIIQKLLDGKQIALITDAGTPCISDPGSELITELNQNKIEYTIIPGACAFVNAFALSGFSAPLTFVGFLPENKTERKKLLDEVKAYQSTLIFYCSPHDLLDDISLFNHAFGNRKACVVRELTKVYEEVVHFNLADGYTGTVKGEFVVLIEGASAVQENWNEFSVEQHVDYYVKLGYTKNDAIKQVAKDRKVAKNVIYNEIVKK